MTAKPVLTHDQPGPWGTSGSLVKTRMDTEAVCDAADDLRRQLKAGTLDPESVLKHVTKIKGCLKILEEHAADPTKYN